MSYRFYHICADFDNMDHYKQRRGHTHLIVAEAIKADPWDVHDLWQVRGHGWCAAGYWPLQVVWSPKVKLISTKGHASNAALKVLTHYIISLINEEITHEIHVSVWVPKKRKKKKKKCPITDDELCFYFKIFHNLKKFTIWKSDGKYKSEFFFPRTNDKLILFPFDIHPDWKPLGLNHVPIAFLITFQSDNQVVTRGFINIISARISY